ncbi:hypothetical protein SLG_21730 [Sphingobium sp. SYK-6]|nr:hypothetical protein SLG_21730 [Sphingobium sp. SYK-6]
MHLIGSDRTRVGLTSSGGANIEVWSAPFGDADAEFEAEIHVPASDVEELARWLLKNA